MAMQKTMTHSARTINTKTADNRKRKWTKWTVQKDIPQQRIRRGLFWDLLGNDPYCNLL